MIDFFAGMFLVGVVGFIIFIVLTCIFDDDAVPATLAFICFLIIVVSCFGMEVEKAKELNICECGCTCCSICDT